MRYIGNSRQQINFSENFRSFTSFKDAYEFIAMIEERIGNQRYYLTNRDYCYGFSFCIKKNSSTSFFVQGITWGYENPDSACLSLLSYAFSDLLKEVYF